MLSCFRWLGYYLVFKHRKALRGDTTEVEEALEVLEPHASFLKYWISAYKDAQRGA